MTPTGVDVIGIGKHPSRGLRKGVVANVESTVEAIKKAVSEAEQAAGVEVDAVYVSIGGGHLRGVNSQGVVAIQGRTREVTASDVARAVDAARAVSLPPDRAAIRRQRGEVEGAPPRGAQRAGATGGSKPTREARP